MRHAGSASVVFLAAFLSHEVAAQPLRQTLAAAAVPSSASNAVASDATTVYGPLLEEHFANASGLPAGWTTTGCWGIVYWDNVPACPLTPYKPSMVTFPHRPGSDSPDGTKYVSSYLASSFECIHQTTSLTAICYGGVGYKPYVQNSKDVYIETPSFNVVDMSHIYVDFSYMIPYFDDNDDLFEWGYVKGGTRYAQETYKDTPTVTSWCSWEAMCTNAGWIPRSAYVNTYGWSNSVKLYFRFKTDGDLITHSSGVYIDDLVVRAPCSFSLSNQAGGFAAEAGGSYFLVYTRSGCPWTAISDAPWLSVTSGSSGSGNGRVDFAVEANPSADGRTGHITVQSEVYTVTQAGDNNDPTISITSPTSNPTHTTSSTPITLGGTASDNVDVTAVDCANVETGTTVGASGRSSWSCSIDLFPGDNTITVTAYDAAGNQRSDSIVVTYAPPDTAPPSGTVAINDDTEFTGSRSVALWLTAADDRGVVGYYVSNSSTTPSAGAAGWQSVGSTTDFYTNASHTLTSGDGQKTVYVWYKDAKPNVSAAATDTIVLDTAPPANGTLYAAPGSAVVQLSWSGASDATSGVSGYVLVYAVGTTPPGDCSGTPLYSGPESAYRHEPLSNGMTYSYRLCTTDRAGNVSSGATATATPQAVDAAPPSSWVSINDSPWDVLYTRTTTVTLSLASFDDVGVDGYYTSNSSASPAPGWAGWVAVPATTLLTTTVPHTLDGGDGPKTVYAWFKDAKPTVSAAATDTIILDATAPLNGSLNATTADAEVQLSWSGFSDATSGIASFVLVVAQASTPPADCSGTPLYAGAATQYSHRGLLNGSTYSYRLCGVDYAGNVSTGATATAVPAALPDGAFRVVGSLSVGRYGAPSTVLPNGRVLVAGGTRGPTMGQVDVDRILSVKSAELYDPAVSGFVSLVDLNEARYGHTSTLLPNGDVLIAGGFTQTAELFDRRTGTFLLTGGTLVARFWPTATLLPNGKVLLAGGYGYQNIAPLPYFASAEIYDPATGQFTWTGNLTAPRHLHTATLLSSGRVLVCGGLTTGDAALSTCDLYDSASGTFTSTGAMAVPRYSHTATLLKDGRVLIAGGFDPAAPYPDSIRASCEIYDPLTGAFSPTGSMNVRRREHVAALLPDGRVLVAGGFNGFYLNSAEIYNPAPGTFKAIGSMSTERIIFHATPLPDGKVLVHGGFDGTTFDLPSAEVYDPLDSRMSIPRPTNVVATATTSQPVGGPGGRASLLTPNGVFASSAAPAAAFGELARVAPSDQKATGSRLWQTVAVDGGSVASPAATPVVQVSWSQAPGATQYEVLRSSNGVTYSSVGTATGTSFIDGFVQADAAYLYKVRAVQPVLSSESWPDVVTAMFFTDPDLVPGVTPIKAAHITELRTAATATRALAGLPPLAFTDGTIAPRITPVKAAHIAELLQAMRETRRALCLPPGNLWMYSLQSPGGVPKASEIQDLRDAVK